MKGIPYRQVHLDFHTSELIPSIGSKFSKEQFQEALKLGHVDSITVFSKCHHGWSYHPTKVNQIHPHLTFDLLGEQLAACKEIGVAAPVYISAGLDEKEANRHPEWLVRNPDESTTWARDFTSSASYHLLCYNTPYLNLLLDQIEEVMIGYNPEAVFLDISSIHPCYCSTCRNQLLDEGKDPRNQKDAMDLAERVYANYGEKVKELIHRYNADTRIFHNAGHITRGRRDLVDYDTHLELESLPTGGWGYDHFPLSASYVMNLGMEYLGMTGKFHTSWGEFGGYKHPNALRYETALSIAFGAKCSVGDQLHPFGEMDDNTYRLIGSAYKEVEEKEKWCYGATGIADIAILSEEAVNSSVSYNGASHQADVGANRIMLEGKYLYRIVDREVDLEPFKLVILPDAIRLDEALIKTLNTYMSKGGKVLATGVSGLKKEEDTFGIEVGAKFNGKSTFVPNYIRPRFDLTNGKSAYIMYEQGYEITPTTGIELATRENPFFNRDTYSFTSHRHTPSNLEKAGSGIVATDQTVYIGWNIFEDYANNGSLHLKEILCYAIDRLLGEDKTLQMSFVDRGITTLTYQEELNRYINHLLFAHTSKRGRDIEVIEDTVPIYNVPVSVKVDHQVKCVYLAPQNQMIDFIQDKGCIHYKVPEVDIHQMIVIELEK